MELLPNNILDMVAGLIGLATSIYTVYSLVVRRWLFKRRLDRMERRLTSRPVALALGVKGNIEQAVERFLHDEELLIPLEPYDWSPPPGINFVRKADFPRIIRDIEAIKARMMNQGVTEIHLFYYGPVSLAVAIGNVFRNFVPLKVYNLVSREGGYELDLIIQRDGTLYSGSLMS